MFVVSYWSFVPEAHPGHLVEHSRPPFELAGSGKTGSRANRSPCKHLSASTEPHHWIFHGAVPPISRMPSYQLDVKRLSTHCALSVNARCRPELMLHATAYSIPLSLSRMARYW